EAGRPLIEGGEEEAKTEGPGHHQADRDIAATKPLAEGAHDPAGRDRERQQSNDGSGSQQDRAGRARKPDVGKRVRGKGEAPKDYEIPDNASGKRDDGSGLVGVLHKGIAEEL